MDTKTATETNRAAWEQVAPIHARHNQAGLVESFRDPSFTLLEEEEISFFQDIGIEGKDVAQVCCNNGRELICVKRLGAARCVGFDGAAGFVEQARELNDAAGTDCAFVHTDIYDMDADYDAAFDVVFITIGVLSWMPDLPGFFAVLERIMKPGAALLIYEQHPILNMMTVGGPDDPVEFELSYFDKSPFIENESLDYWQGEKYDAKETMSFSHTLAETIMAGVNLRLAVEYVEEFPDHISNTWYNVEKQVHGFPMSFVLRFRKPD